MILNDGICLNQEKGWFLGMKTPMLYEVSMSDFEINPLCMIPAKSGISERVSQKIIYKNDKLYILPDRSKTLYILDLNNVDIAEIDVPEAFARPCMLNGWFDKQILYCYMHLDDSIASFDIETKKFLGTHMIFENGKKGAFESAYVDGCCYFISKDDNRICKYNLIEDKKLFVELDRNAIGFNTIVYQPMNNMMYVTGLNEDIYIWSVETNEIIDVIRIKDGYEHTSKEGFRYFSSHVCGDKIAFLSRNFDENRDSHIVLLQNDSNYDVMHLDGTKGNNQNIIETVYEDKLVFFNINNNELYRVNVDLRRIDKIAPRTVNKRNTNRINSGLILKEDEFTSLKWFVEGLTI